LKVKKAFVDGLKRRVHTAHGRLALPKSFSL
jgi:hypothetical protein